MKPFVLLIISILALAMSGCASGSSDTKEQSQPESTMQAAGEAEESEPAVASAGDEEGSSAQQDGLEVNLAEQPTVSGPGTLSPVAIANLAEKRQQRTTTCFQSMPGDIEEPSRQVMLTLRLSLDGAVLDVQSSAQDEFGECVAAEVKRWDFPKPKGGEVESTIKFEYRRLQEDEVEE
jgi:Na+-transporting methylmalonyl-CoA/oxaloacetate decarboxylase gamma subunit